MTKWIVVISGSRIVGNFLRVFLYLSNLLCEHRHTAFADIKQCCSFFKKHIMLALTRATWMKLENVITLSERSQSQGWHIARYHLHEISRGGLAVETGSRLVVAGGWGTGGGGNPGVTAKGYAGFLLKWWHSLRLTMVMVVHSNLGVLDYLTWVNCMISKLYFNKTVL